MSLNYYVCFLNLLFTLVCYKVTDKIRKRQRFADNIADCHTNLGINHTFSRVVSVWFALRIILATSWDLHFKS